MAATLTPLYTAFEPGGGHVGTCDLSRIGLVPLGELRRIDDPSLNVLLFIPLGLALGLVPGSRAKRAILIGALILPMGIELTQLLMAPLQRACQSADVFDNLTGLVGGLALGSIVLLVARRVSGLRRPTARRVSTDRTRVGDERA